jgi:multidrug transporter EmrE-like cation transporter
MSALPISQTIDKEWFLYSSVLSIFFISGFWFVGSTVHKYGIGVATLMQKMSLILTVSVVMIMYSESTHFLKIIGLTLAILSIVIYNRNSLSLSSMKESIWVFPMMAWLTSGIIEIFLFLAQRKNTIQGDDASFVSMIFLGAGSLGLMGVLFTNNWRPLINTKNILAGVLLGVPNFFSMYFLVKLIDIGWEGSIVFPINNIGILVLSSIGALWLFREQHDKYKWIGLILAILSITLLALFTK